jgi:hypothetical protein
MLILSYHLMKRLYFALVAGMTFTARPDINGAAHATERWRW